MDDFKQYVADGIIDFYINDIYVYSSLKPCLFLHVVVTQNDDGTFDEWGKLRIELNLTARTFCECFHIALYIFVYNNVYWRTTMGAPH